VLVLTVVLNACEAPSSRADEESDGVSPIGDVRNSPPYESWGVDSTPVLRVGLLAQERDEFHFSNIRFAASLSDGRLVIVDGGSLEIRWFNADGSFSHRAGGRGEGPGELSRVQSGALLAGDSLVIFDPRNQRLTWFDSQGTLARTRRLDLGVSLGVALQEFERGHLLVTVEGPNHNFGGASYNYTRDSLFAVLVTDASAPDTILRLTGAEAVTWVDYVDGTPSGTRQMELPFGERTLVGGPGTSVAVVRSNDDAMRFFSLDGGIVHSAHRSDLDPPLVSPELWQQYVTTAVERAMTTGASAELAREGAEERLELLPEGRRVPNYDRMLIDRVGERIWLRDFMLPWMSDAPQDWTVHDEQGRILARLETPAGFDLMHVAQDRLVGVDRDGMGVEYVAVYQLMRPRR
jgi:hypothetical protein